MSQNFLRASALFDDEQKNALLRHLGQVLICCCGIWYCIAYSEEMYLGDVAAVCKSRHVLCTYIHICSVQWKKQKHFLWWINADVLWKRGCKKLPLKLINDWSGWPSEMASIFFWGGPWVRRSCNYRHSTVSPEVYRIKNTFFFEMYIHTWINNLFCCVLFNVNPQPSYTGLIFEEIFCRAIFIGDCA